MQILFALGKKMKNWFVGEVPWYKFWNPHSGFIGGVIFGGVLYWSIYLFYIILFA